MFGPGRQKDPAKAAARRAEVRQAIGDLLTPVQWNRLKQLEWQSTGPMIFFERPGMAEELGLTDKQKADIVEAFTAGPPDPKKLQRQDVGERMTAVCEFHRLIMTRVRKILTEAQKVKLDAILGPPLQGTFGSLRGLAFPRPWLKAGATNDQEALGGPNRIATGGPPDAPQPRKLPVDVPRARQAILGLWHASTQARFAGRPGASPDVWESKDNEIVITRQDRATGKETKSIWKYRIDPAKDYAEIDLVPSDGLAATHTLKGIYRITNDVLRICHVRPTSLEPERLERPRFFRSERDDVVVVTLRRPAKD